MACVTNGTAFARKKKMTWKECCNKWGRAAMEQQQGKGSAYTTEVSRDQLAANIFAFIPTTEWHSYYVARVGLSANALKLKYAISFGEKYEHGAIFNRCPECDCAIDEHYCDECEIRFKKADDNIIKNMNETAKALGGWENYYAATWKQFEAAKYDMEQIAPTAGMLERRAKEAEKLLGKKAKRHEIAEVQQLWEEFEAAKELEAEEETFFEHEASLSSIPEPTTYEEAFPQLKVTSDVSINTSQASEVVEDNLGFFFGEIPAKIALPTIPILEILPAAPILNLNGELNDIAEVKQPEVIDEVCVTTQPKETDIIQSGLKKYELVNGKFQKVKKLPKTLYPWGDRETTPGKTQHAMVTKWVRKKMSEEADKEEKIWSAWEHTKKQQLEKRLDLKVKWRYGMFRLVKKTRKDNQRQRQKQRAMLEQKKLEMMPQQIVSTISIGGGLAPSHMKEATQKSGMIFCTPSMKKRKLFKPLVISNGNLDNLTQAVLKIACKKEMNVEFIGKRVIKGDYTRKENVRHLRLQLKHMKGLRHSIDLRIPSGLQALIVKAARVAAWKKIYNTQNVVKGMSGFVLNPQRLQGKTGHAPQGIFVVRGAFKGVLYDARMKIGRSILPYMEQF
nr:P1 protein [Sweet potato virus 2]